MSSSRTRSSAHYSAGDKLAPKFKDCTYDSIKKPEPKELRKWLALISSIVRNYIFENEEAGAELEAFMDSLTGRRAKKRATRPAFLDTEMFSWGSNPDEDGGSHTSAEDRRSTNESITEVGDVEDTEPFVDAPDLQSSGPVSYTHLTLPTKA